MVVTGRDILREARANIGTPYRWKGRTRGHGLDCAGNVEAAARGAGLNLTVGTKYREKNSPESVVAKLRAAFGDPVLGVGEVRLGMVMAIRKGARQFHLGIYSGPGLVEADNSPGVMRVVEHSMSWRQMMREKLGAWSIPGVTY